MALFTFRKWPSLNLFLLLFGHVCSRRRAMVNKLWFRELARKWFQGKQQPPHARCFSEPKCQDRLHGWYLVYRWLMFGCWLGMVICSIFEIGATEYYGALEKWPIYLTNWDLALGLSQALLGAFLVSRRWRLQRCQEDFEASSLAYGKLEKVYWCMYVITSSLALGVTVTYWGLVYDPKVNYIDLLNFLVHVSNSLLMMLDFCVVGVPFELRHFWWCPILVCFYLLFTVVYYAAGGLDKKGTHRIYNVLDWEKPGRTLIVCTGGLIIIVITHCLLYFLAGFRDRTYDKRRKLDLDDKQDIAKRKSESCV